jgi:hypothetical protein
MPDALLLLAAVAANVLGFAWLALAMDVHWRQVRGPQAPSRGAAKALRVMGIAGLASSLALCLLADYASIASLVWIMSLAAAALTVAFTLTWRPRALAPLVIWIAR